MQEMGSVVHLQRPRMLNVILSAVVTTLHGLNGLLVQPLVDLVIKNARLMTVMERLFSLSVNFVQTLLKCQNGLNGELVQLHAAMDLWPGQDQARVLVLKNNLLSVESLTVLIMDNGLHGQCVQLLVALE